MASEDVSGALRGVIWWPSIGRVDHSNNLPHWATALTIALFSLVLFFGKYIKPSIPDTILSYKFHV